MITTKQLLECDLTHKHGGNGFVMVEDLDKDYCRVVSYKSDELDYLVRLAAKEMLSITPEQLWVEEAKKYVSGPSPQKISAGVLSKLSKIRAGIRSGKLKVENNRVVEA